MDSNKDIGFYTMPNYTKSACRIAIEALYNSKTLRHNYKSLRFQVQRFLLEYEINPVVILRINQL